MDQTNYYSSEYYTANYTANYQGSEWQTDATQGLATQGDATQGGYVSQEGYYENYNTAGDEEVKSEGTPTYDEPAEDNEEERGEKRAAEDSGASDVKRVRNDESKNPVQELNEAMPGLEYRCIDASGEQHAANYTMQITVGGQVFEAEGCNKKIAKQLVAEAALKYLANMPKQKDTYRQGSKNPSTILNEIKPLNHTYELLEELSENGLNYYRMLLTVDGQQFEAKGRSKLLAKSYAAMAALEKFYNLQFNVPDFEQMPTFEGDEQEWIKYKPKTNLFEGKNAVSEMYKLYQPFICVINEVEPNPDNIKYQCTVKVEGLSFIGNGTSKQSSKTNACLEALHYLKQNGILDRKRAEADADRVQRLAQLKADLAAATAQATQSS